MGVEVKNIPLLKSQIFMTSKLGHRAFYGIKQLEYDVPLAAPVAEKKRTSFDPKRDLLRQVEATKDGKI